jgi:hypothetical protein
MPRLGNRNILKRQKPQYIAAALGWAYSGLFLGFVIAAIFSPEHKLVLDFNRFGELWFDVAVFTIAFLLLTWLLFFKLLQKRRTDNSQDRKGLP